MGAAPSSRLSVKRGQPHRRRLVHIGAFLLLAIAGRRAAAQHAALGRIQGVVADSLRGGPLGGATVVATPARATVDTSFHGALTDSLGRFELAGLAPGSYTLSVDHERIDSTGIGAPAVTVAVRGDDTLHVALAIPAAATLRRALCARSLADSTEGVMLGMVRRVDGRPLAGGAVVFSWGDFDVDRRTATVRGRQLTASARTDSAGVYRACGLPVLRTLWVQAQGAAGMQSGVIEEQIDASGVLRRDLHVSAAADSAAPATPSSPVAPRGVLLAGSVTTVSGRPIASAQVSLMGTPRVTATNAQGEFRLVDVPLGTQGLRVIALGYLPQTQRVEVSAAGAQAEVRMENAAVVLDSLRVIAKRTSAPTRSGSREFERRRRLGVGTFLTEQQIAATHAQVVTDIFRHVNGVHLAMPRGPGSEIVVSDRGAVSMLGGPTVCPLDIYLDGMRVQRSDINMVNPGSLQGVEVHSVATLPPQYKAGSCGALFLWTK